MKHFITGSRYLIIVPILGLVIAASFFFIFGGIGLCLMLIDLLVDVVSQLAGHSTEIDSSLVVIEVVEYVHTFLVGTVLYITAIGFYQLFIGRNLDFPDWLKIDSTEELESNLIGVTVVVLAVNFMSAVFIGGIEDLIEYGAGIALPIAALGLFLGLRAWSTKLNKEIAFEEEERSLDQTGAQEESSQQ